MNQSVVIPSKLDLVGHHTENNENRHYTEDPPRQVAGAIHEGVVPFPDAVRPRALEEEKSA